MTTHEATPALFLTTDEVAELFGRDSTGRLRLSARSVSRHWRTIPGAVHIGRKLLFRRAPLMAWIDNVRAGTVIPFARSA